MLRLLDPQTHVCYMKHMANLSPVVFDETFHMRCNEDWLDKLDDLRTLLGTRPIPSRADIVRALVDREWQAKVGNKRK